MNIQRIYYETQVAADPRTIRLRERFSHLPQIEVASYKDVFNRPGQNFQAQKQSQAMILARKNPVRIFEASERVDSFHRSVPVHFIDPVRNCVYNCDYCFLQGMHASGHLLYFVNHNEVADEVTRMTRQQPIYLSISYLTDLMGMEAELGICRDWILTAAGNPNLTVEIRTKSESYPVLRRVMDELGGPPDNVILVWSLTPSPIAARYERGTASFQGRLASARLALQEGWRVRLCFDPVMRVEGWREQYSDCIQQTFHRLPPEKIEQVSFGVFRLSADFLKRLRSVRRDSPILYHPFTVENGLATYSQNAVAEMHDFLEQELSRLLEPGQHKFVHG